VADEQLETLIADQFKICQGNAIRVMENLESDYATPIAYSSLTRKIRNLSLRKGNPRRSGEYDFAPGDEIQLDTSPHKVFIAGKLTPAQCIGTVLAYSRRLFIQYSPNYTRFEAKHFLIEALTFFDGACPLCIVDNTSVVVAHGSGANADIAPEMEAFGDFFGLRFLAHEIGHADRKAVIEKNFAYAEGNFLAGRRFSGWDDLNKQARKWCDTVANKKPKRSLSGMSPQEVYLKEKKYLKPLPAYIPPVYQALPRMVDMTGYVNIDTNRYSVPENLVGKQVEVHKLWDRIVVYFGARKVAEHPRCIGKRDQKIKAGGHHKPFGGKKRRQGPSPEEKLLYGYSTRLDGYVVELKKRAYGRGRRKLNQLLTLKRIYPEAAFDQAIKQAYRYGLYDLNRLEQMILSHVAGDFFTLCEDDS